MAASRRRNAGRIIRPTVLVAVEGDAEQQFLRLLRSTYLGGRSGRSLTISHAGGKGGRNVLRHAVGRRRNERFDFVGAVFDGDQDWGEWERRYAEEHRIVAVVNDPCLERTLFALHGVHLDAATAEIKDRFAERYGGPAHTAGLLARNFGRNHIDSGRSPRSVIDQLLRLLGV